MSIIPLDLQRMCERRWAARFSRSVEMVASRKQGPKPKTQQIAGPDKSKRKPRRGEAAGSKTFIGSLSAGSPLQLLTIDETAL
jgi:hypothetical protein